MTQDQIEGNKLIAEFMGSVVTLEDHTKGNEDYCKEQGFEKWLIQTWSKPDGFNDAWGWGKYRLGKWEYHSSWDWLMPVIDKIESLHGCSYKIGLQYAFGYVADASQHGDPYIIRAIGKTRIDTAYNLVIKFIKWHNK